MEKFILDTNIFFNMEAGLGLGDKTEGVVVGLTKKISELKKNKKAEFFMPPRAVDEFLSFFEDKNQPFIKDFLSQITVKSPDASRSNFSAAVFYKLVDDIRLRSYRGLTVGEEEIGNAARLMMGADGLSKKDFEIKVGSVVKKFRERYRNATRTGFLDSTTDLDLIVLAMEQDAYIVTTDEGVLGWGRTFGVKEMPSGVFRKRLEDLLV
ncbi:MAG: RNA ligase partner protein [Patescibacteria group bacterium]